MDKVNDNKSDGFKLDEDDEWMQQFEVNLLSIWEYK